MCIFCDILGELVVSVTLNLQPLGVFNVSGSNLVISLPGDAILLDTVNRLILRYSNPRQPSDDDNRELAFAFKKLVIERSGNVN